VQTSLPRELTVYLEMEIEEEEDEENDVVRFLICIVPLECRKRGGGGGVEGW